MRKKICTFLLVITACHLNSLTVKLNYVLLIEINQVQLRAFIIIIIINGLIIYLYISSICARARKVLFMENSTENIINNAGESEFAELRF